MFVCGIVCVCMYVCGEICVCSDSQSMGSTRPSRGTNRETAEEDDEKGLAYACDTHNPAETQEEDHSKNVLKSWQVDAHDGS